MHAEMLSERAERGRWTFVLAFSAPFLWEHSLFAPEGAQRWWAAPGENSWNCRTQQLMNCRTQQLTSSKFQQKMSRALRQPSHVFCSLSSTQTNVIIKTVNLDLKPPGFIWRQGIHALQQPRFCLDYWNRAPSFFQTGYHAFLRHASALSVHAEITSLHAEIAISATDNISACRDSYLCQR